MNQRRDCPLCGDPMRLKSREMTERIPGHSQIVKRLVREWVCPGCDYYEEDVTRQEQAR